MDGWGAVSRTATLDAAELSAQAARAVVRDVCTAAHVPEDSTETALLLASELVTNAVVHAGGTPVLDVDVRPSRLRVTVTDDADGRPRVTNGSLLDEGGRGLMLVETLATAWGTDPQDPRGKSVWFELQPG